MELNIHKADKIKEYIQFGMKLSVVIKFGPNDKYSFQCNLVGIKEGQYLILDMPSKAVEDLITRRTSNVRIIVRGITDTELGDIIAFTTEIISVVSRPTWLMFIKPPYDFESKPIRTNRRIKINLPVDVVHEEKKHTAILRDLSVSGCGLYINKPINLNKDDVIKINTRFESYPDNAPECKIANLRKFTDETFLGIRFEPELEISDRLRHEIIDKAILHLE